MTSVTMRVALLAAFVLLAATCIHCDRSFSDRLAASKAACVMNETLPYRLPLTMHPNHYDLKFQPGLEAPYALNGTVTVDLSIVAATSCIVLHQSGLVLHDVTVSQPSSSGSDVLSPLSIELDEEKQFAIMYFEDVLPVADVSLSYQYSGYAYTGEGSGKGFFVSALQLEPPTDAKMFATQFEGPYARTAFPCFDEPALKATFVATVSAYLPSYIPTLDDLTLLFNTRALFESSDDETNLKVVQFEKTPIPISTYLVAFAIGDFSYLEKSSNGIRYRVYCSPDKQEYAAFALNITISLIEYWEGLFGVDYPFNKLDQIAVPKIIEDGMENMGLVTYWPPWLLENSEYSTQGQYEQAAQVIAHELVHMWFGDMVTLPWWSETYNNEGFARYFQYLGCQYLFPEWDTWEAGSSSFFSFAYNFIATDSKGLSRPLVVPPGEVSGTVDSVVNSFSGPTYPKGASVNRMINIYMGDDDWYNGLGYHLKQNLYGNPRSQDILRDLDTYTNGTYQITEKFMPWLTLSGFPVVTVSLSDSELAVSQTPVSPFLPRYDDALWFVSLSVQLSSDPTDTTVVDLSTDSATFAVTSGDLLLANPEHTGYFVVNYADDADWDAVLSYAAASSYDPVQRKLIAQDVFILSQMAHTTVALPLNLMTAFSNIQDSELWDTILARYYTVSVALQKQSYYSSAVAAPVVAALQPLVSLVDSSSNTTSTFADLEAAVLFWDVFYGDQAVADSLLSAYEAGQTIAASKLQATYWTVGRYGSQADYAGLVSLFSAGATDDELTAVVLGLTATTDTATCTSTLDLFSQYDTLSDRVAHAGVMLRYNLACRGLAWTYVKQQGEALFHAEGSAASSTVLGAFSGVFSSSGEYLDVQRYLELNSSYLTSEEAHDALVGIEINMNIINANASLE